MTSKRHVFQLMVAGATGPPGLSVTTLLVKNVETETVPTHHLVVLDLVQVHHRLNTLTSAVIAKVENVQIVELEVSV